VCITLCGVTHGMRRAAELGLGDRNLPRIHHSEPKIKPENLVLIGIRDLDKGEKETITKLNIKTFTMHEIDLLGMPEVISQTVNYLKDKTNGIHLSFDLNRINTVEASGVGTQARGGLTYRASHFTTALLSDSNLI